MPAPSTPTFYAVLLKASLRLRRRQLVQGAWGLTLLLMLSLCGLAMLASFHGVATGWLGLLLLVVLATWLAAATVWVLLPWLRRLPLHELVRDIEARRPDLANQLSTAVYLHEQVRETEQYGFSPDLCAAVHDSASQAAANLDQALEPGTTRHPWPAYAMAAGAVLFLLTPTGRDGVTRVWHAVVSDASTLPREPTATVSVPGDVYIPLGREYEFYALAKPVQKNVAPRLHVRPPGGAWETLPLTWIGPDTGRYFHKFPELNRSLEYVVTHANTSSAPHRLTTVKQPEITHWRAMVTPPRYTGLAPSVQTPDKPQIDALPGSRVDFAGAANHPLERAVFLREGQPEQELELVDQNHFRGTWVVSDGPTPRVVIYDAFRQSREVEVGLRLLHDRAPKVVITHPALISNVPESGRVFIRGDAADDYGVALVELVHRPDFGDREETRTALFRAGDVDGVTTEVHVSHLFDLNPLDLLPGDEVSFWAEATDNDEINGPNVARSAVHRLVVPALGDVYAQTFARQDESIDNIRRVLEDQQRITSQIRQMKERLQDRGSRMDGGEGAYMTQTEMERLAMSQEELTRQLERISGEMDKQSQELRQNLEMSLRTVEKHQRITELLNELLDDDMKEMMRQFHEMVAQLEQQMDDSLLEQMQFRMEDFEAQLDRMLALLENSFLEQQLEVMAARLDELKDMQRSVQEDTLLAAESEVSDPTAEAAALEQRQETLNQETENLLENLEELADKFQESNPEVAEQLREMAEQARQEDLSEKMEQAREQLGQQDFQQAMDPQGQAHEMLMAMAREMRECQTGMGGEQMDLDSLLRLATRGLALSTEATELAEHMDGLDRRMEQFLVERRNQLAGEVGLLRSETRRLLDDFIAFSRKSPMVDYEVVRLLQEGIAVQDLAIERTRNGEMRGVRLAGQSSLGYLNTAVSRIIDSYEMAASQSGGGSGGGMEDYFRQMREMIQRQRGLNTDTERLMAQPQMEDMFQQMMQAAAEQRALRERMQELQQQFEQFGNQLGDLGEISDKMSEVEKRLEEGDQSERLKELQEEVLQRMMDAGRSLEKDEMTEERLAEAADQDFHRPPTDDRLLDNLDFDEQILRSAEGLYDMPVPPEYRDQAIEYFRALARERVQ